MSIIKNENYIAIQGWMVNELNLKGNALMIYAIIYGFSQIEGHTFSGSLQYLAEWTNSTKQGVIKSLKKLIENGLITKKEKYVNNVKFVEYYVTKFNEPLNKVERGIKQSLHNNIEDNIEHNINISKDIDKSSKKYGNDEINEMFEKWNELFGYTPKSSKQNRFAAYNMLRAKDKGKEWLIHTMMILREAQKDKYAGNQVLGISNFADLQHNYDKVWKWGSGKAIRNSINQKVNIKI